MNLNTKDAIKTILHGKDGSKPSKDIIDGGIIGTLEKSKGKKFRPLGNIRDGITTGALGLGALAGGKEGAQADALDRDVRQAMGLKEKGWLGRNKGAIIGSAASLAGGLAGRAVAKKAGLSLAGLGTLAGIGAGSKLAGTLANKYVADRNRKERDREILAAKNKEQSNFTKNMYQTRQFNKLTDFVKKNQNAFIGAGIGTAAGVAGGYMMDKKAKREGNLIKRNAGLIAGGLAGAGLGAAAGHYGLHNKVKGLFKKKGGDQVAVPELKQESNYLNYLASKYYSGEANTPMNTSNSEAKKAQGFLNRLKTGASNFGKVAKNNWKGAAIGAVGLGAAGAGIGRVVASRRGKNKKKAMAIGAGIGAVAGAGLGMAAQHYGLPNKVAGLFRKQ